MDTWVLPTLLGLGLSAATGYRTFLPLLMLSATAHFGWFGVELNSSFGWLGSTAALVALLVATGFELTTDLIPGVDNVKSVVGNLTRPLAAAVATGAVFANLDPSAAAIAGLIIGAPTALAFATAQTGTRAASTATTAGAANPVISVLEDIVSFTTALIALVVPVLIPLVLLALGWLIYRAVRRFRSRPAPA
ncbi:DUF4126 domain-containing protein [Skermania piniformis]|uniref:DUF4126 domain-containing protein n=1 Tax=Skermania pinensis TaxID=39122 RepID=A0ABX8S9Q7_9ACTN|nr:DUF4126 domain-containing protein [Skermania piniformis]QXQ13215.1 DUF4126 domain-containing protein [Skermania piniformis]